METIPNDTKKVFKELGTCSRTFFYLLNREFGHPTEEEERAADSLAGGIMQAGHQCGMLWGAALAVGAESFRRAHHCSRATALAITATQHLLASFSETTHTANCRDITGTDFSSRFQMMRYMIFRTGRCFSLAEKWAPKAIQAAEEGLAQEEADLPQETLSCASETVKKMGASEEETAMVAGFAGGLGLSGHGCGALSAAIWMSSLAWGKENPEKWSFKKPNAEKILNAFNEATGNEMRCPKICGRRFETVEEHTEFVKNGGCGQLIEALAQIVK